MSANETTLINNDYIHICMICDANYLKPTTVAVYSIKKNKLSSSSYHIHILINDKSKEYEKIFNKFKSNDFLIDIKHVTPKIYQDNKAHVSNVALIKFQIPDIFNELEKILYLDGDIIVQADLKELYDIDLADNYLAAMEDLGAVDECHPAKIGLKGINYFNSGVMLLNLNKMRNDDIPAKLFYYRINGINKFMDQDAINSIMSNKCIMLNFKYNTMMRLLYSYSFNSICEYYNIDENQTREEICKNALIVHLTGRLKPWDFESLPYSEEWMQLYEEVFGERYQRKDKKQFIATWDNKTPQSEYDIKSKVIVSLTTFAFRYASTSKVIQIMLSQTIKVDKVVLYVDKNGYDESEPPSELTKLLKNERFEIRTCEDIGPHTKYFYAMQDFPNDIIITVDDDIWYPFDLVENLLRTYVQYPNAVAANRVHLIKFNDDGDILSYNRWKFEFTSELKPSHALIATGVGGILYPPKILNTEILLNKKAIKSISLKADDLWLKAVEVISGIPVVYTNKFFKLYFIGNTQEIALSADNVAKRRNDAIMKDIIGYFQEYDILPKIYTEILPMNYKELKNEYTKLQKKLDFTRNSVSYKIGRFITWIPRKLRLGILAIKKSGILYSILRLCKKMGIIVPKCVSLNKSLYLGGWDLKKGDNIKDKYIRFWQKFVYKTIGGGALIN